MSVSLVGSSEFSKITRGLLRWKDAWRILRKGARDGWRMPRPHSCSDDTGAGADAQPHEARVGPFRAPATGKLSEQRVQRVFLNAMATFVAAANRSATSAQRRNSLEMRLGQCPFGRSPGRRARVERVQKTQAAATLVAAAFSACGPPSVCPAWCGSPHELFRASPSGLRYGRNGCPLLLPST